MDKDLDEKLDYKEFVMAVNLHVEVCGHKRVFQAAQEVASDLISTALFRR